MVGGDPSIDHFANSNLRTLEAQDKSAFEGEDFPTHQSEDPPNGQNGHIRKIKSITKVPAIDPGEDACPTSQPDDERHRLQNQGSLMVRKRKMSWVVTQKVAEHVAHQERRAQPIDDGRHHGIPVTLGIGLGGRNRRHMDVHGHLDRNQDGGGYIPHDDRCR